MPLWSYFTDPVLQAPMLSSILMCFTAALIGVSVFLRKRSLLGEALSHATYPGVVLSALVASFFLSSEVVILAGAFIFALLGLYVMNSLEKTFKVKADAALCFVIASFFGVGVLIASHIQFTHVLWYKAVQVFLYGQVATMVGVHVALYSALSGLILLVLWLYFYPLRMVLFDYDFSRSVGVPCKGMEGLLSVLLALAIVIGIRSVGVVLMAGMLIAPAIGARQWSSQLYHVLWVAGCMGAVSGFLGNYFSMEIPLWAQERFSLPTGPMILLSSVGLCLASLLFAPQRGLVSRLWRIFKFRRRCAEENVLKSLWRHATPHIPYLLLLRLKRQGWLEKGPQVRLSKDGVIRAAKIVRLHRLWEAYLVFLGQGLEKVHRSAEEMEHIITPELEQKLAEILGNPQHDPHHQPIPAKEL